MYLFSEFNIVFLVLHVVILAILGDEKDFPFFHSKGLVAFLWSFSSCLYVKPSETNL